MIGFWFKRKREVAPIDFREEKKKQELRIRLKLLETELQMLEKTYLNAK